MDGLKHAWKLIVLCVICMFLAGATITRPPGSGGTLGPDSVGTNELDDGIDTPAINRILAVDPADISQFQYADCEVTATGFDCPADTDDGGCLTLKEGSNDGSNIYQVCVPDAGLTATYAIDVEDDASPNDPLVSTPAFEMHCHPFENLVATDDDIEIFMARAAVVVQSVGCHCNSENGSCTTPAQISLEDRAGNAMTHGTATCSSGTSNTTFVSVTAGGGLVAGEGVQFDIDNTPSTGNQYLVCLAVQEH